MGGMPTHNSSGVTIARRVIVGLSIFSSLACLGGSCNDERSSFTPPGPTISEVLPCAALPGEEVRIVGFNLGGVITIGGKTATVVSGNSNQVIARLSIDASGSGLVMNSQNGFASYPLRVLTGVAKAEIEPNDDINYSDATDTAGERKGSGNLSSTNDRDHFRVDCLDPAASYKIKVTPPNFGPVYANGGTVILDANGEATLSSGSVTRFIGFTGHQGAYSFELTKI